MSWNLYIVKNVKKNSAEHTHLKLICPNEIGFISDRNDWDLFMMLSDHDCRKDLVRVMVGGWNLKASSDDRIYQEVCKEYRSRRKLLDMLDCFPADSADKQQWLKFWDTGSRCVVC